MGKSLIVKGADFSLNAVGSNWRETELAQGYANSNSSAQTYGKLSINSSSYYMNLMLAKIYIPSGETAKIKITDNGVVIPDLNVAYVASPNDVALVDQNIVTDITSNLHPITDSIRDSDGVFTITNNGANGLFYYLDFGYDTISGPEVSILGKKCLYKRVMAV